MLLSSSRRVTPYLQSPWGCCVSNVRLLLARSYILGSQIRHQNFTNWVLLGPLMSEASTPHVGMYKVATGRPVRCHFRRSISRFSSKRRNYKYMRYFHKRTPLRLPRIHGAVPVCPLQLQAQAVMTGKLRSPLHWDRWPSDCQTASPRSHRNRS